MGRAALVIVIALLLAVVALVAMAPASLLDGRLAAATDGRIRLAETEGTVWSGRGTLADNGGAWRIPLAWHIAPLSIAQGALEVALVPLADGTGPRGNVTLRQDGVLVQSASLAVPAAAIRSVRSTVPLPEFGGDVQLDAPRFRYDGRAGDGTVDVRWDRARLVWNGGVVNLGTITARMEARGPDLVGTLSNAGGSARINADVALAPRGVNVNGTLTPGADLPPDIARLLAQLGPPDGNGAIRVAWRSGRR